MADLGDSLVESGEMEALRSAARRFADEVISPMVGTEGRDGDLAQLDAVLSQAAELGIMASLDPEAAAYDYGVWGAASLAAGATASLLILEELARACAGVAGCVHFAGLGAAALAGPQNDAAQLDGARIACTRAAVVACPPRWAAIAHRGPEAEDHLLLRAGQIDGRARFVWSAPGSDTLVMFAAGEDGLERVVVRRDAAGLGLMEVQGRMGLAACSVHDVVAKAAVGVRLGPAPVQEHWVQEHWARNWLGLCAIAIGNARGALEGAHTYAVERRQGGALIASHPAVQLLLGGAEARICTSRAALLQLAQGTRPDLRHATMLKLRITSDCAEAVSDCLQVLGGYGYMEDYRQEKRLRDALTLRSMGGRAADLACRLARSFEGGAG